MVSLWPIGPGPGTAIVGRMDVWVWNSMEIDSPCKCGFQLLLSDFLMLSLINGLSGLLSLPTSVLPFPFIQRPHSARVFELYPFVYTLLRSFYVRS